MNAIRGNDRCGSDNGAALQVDDGYYGWLVDADADIAIGRIGVDGDCLNAWLCDCLSGGVVDPLEEGHYSGVGSDYDAARGLCWAIAPADELPVSAVGYGVSTAEINQIQRIILELGGSRTILKRITRIVVGESDGSGAVLR